MECSGPSREPALKMKPPTVRCPNCGTEAEHPIVPPRFRGAGEEVLRHLGGWLLSRLWDTSREQRFLCASCDEFFYARTENSKLARVILILLALLIASAIYDWATHG